MKDEIQKEIMARVWEGEDSDDPEKNATVPHNFNSWGDDDAKFAAVLKAFDVNDDGKIKKTEFMEVLCPILSKDTDAEEPAQKKAKTSEEPGKRAR